MAIADIAVGITDALSGVQKERREGNNLESLVRERLLDRALREREAETRRVESDRTYQRGVAMDKSLTDSREAEAARDRAAAEKDANRAKGLSELIANPAALAAMTPVQRLLTMNQYGVANVGIHDLEDPAQHTAHVDADAARKADADFGQHKRIRDYDNAHPSPVRGSLRTVADDPSLPLGSQRYIAEIAAKHGGDFDGARAELMAYLNDPRTVTDHPRLSPAKAIDALRRAASTPGGSTVRPAGGGSVFSSSGAAAPGGGQPRIVVGGAVTGRGGAPPAPAGGGGIPPAVREQAAAVLRGALRRDVTEADLQKFFSSPTNRARFGLAVGQ